jgi:hypothetical protein
MSFAGNLEKTLTTLQQGDWPRPADNTAKAKQRLQCSCRGIYTHANGTFAGYSHVWLGKDNLGRQLQESEPDKQQQPAADRQGMAWQVTH